MFHRRLSVYCRALLRPLILLHRVGLPSSDRLPNARIFIAVIGLRNRRALCDALVAVGAMIRPGTDLAEIHLVALISVAILLFTFTSRALQSGPSESCKFSATYRQFTLQPRLFPCLTTHTRLFPMKHSFSYSYLYAGVPVGWIGFVNSFLSADIAKPALQSQSISMGKTWLSVEGCDYLQRTTSEATLLQKLHNYLNSQGVLPTQYPYVYLLTAPRFLGFSFNPVSFWYLYSEQRHLTAMILEVNNTFDERRMYFMQQADPLSSDGQPTNRKDIFSHSWSKDFHVSPFNDREGVYTLKAHDPFAPRLTGQGQIDNTITLLSPDRKPKLVARVFSAHQSIPASSVGRLQAIRFLSQWWWVGFATNVRILHEARKLWTKKLQVYYRPEVISTSIGRRATSEEDILSESFLTFLRYLQKHSAILSSIKYTAAAGKHRDIPIIISSLTDAKSGIEVNLHILTPAFYSSFIQLSDPAEAFNRLCMCEADDERLAVLSDPSVFSQEITMVATARAESLTPAGIQSCNGLDAGRNHQLLRAMMILFLLGPQRRKISHRFGHIHHH